MSPSRTFILALLVWLTFSIFAAVWPGLLDVWEVSGFLLLFLSLLDAWLIYRIPIPKAQRQIPGTLAAGVWCDVRIRFSNPGTGTLQFEAHDGIPSAMDSRGMPHRLRIEPDTWAEMVYRVYPKERGEHHFEACHLRLDSPFGLWRKRARCGKETPVKVFPNFAAVKKYAQLSTSHRLSQLGIHRKRRRGEGMEFHQLRDYREGDSLRQIDWKATSRLRRLISREYQDERDQQVIFLLDCGRRMRVKESELSHFDHTLTALLLAAYVALREGDAVGLLTFAGPERWLPPRKTAAALDDLLKALYDVQPTTAASDYLQVARLLRTRVRKRALVVLVTNLRDEDDDTLIPALQLLRKSHLVLLANLRERTLTQTLDESVETFDEALLHGATHEYLDQRRKAFDRIHAQGVISLDVPPEKLPVALVDRYLALKRGGAL